MQETPHGSSKQIQEPNWQQLKEDESHNELRQNENAP